VVQASADWEEKSLEMNHPSTLSIVYSIAIVFKKQGKYGEARELPRRAPAGESKSLGENHPTTFGPIHGMATVFFYNEALELHRRILAGQEKPLGKGHPDTLVNISAMAPVSIGKYDEALRLVLHTSRLGPLLEQTRARSSITYFTGKPPITG
jgi:hypothetical protein